MIEERGTASALHHQRLPVPDRRLVRVATVTGPAVVLGSAQVAARLDPKRAEALGVEVVRRRSGGGAVVLWPGHQVWLDVCLPRGDPLWHDDIGRSAGWLGEVLATALVKLGATEAAAHTCPFRPTAWSHQVCFAGRAPGEVLVGDRKVVGTSQRRTRQGAVFQVLVALAWTPEILVEVLGLPAVAALEVAGSGIGLAELLPGVGPGVVLEAVVAALPS